MDIPHPSRRKRKQPIPLREAHLVSLSARDDARPFGSYRDGDFVPNARGDAIAACWRQLGGLRPGLEPDAFALGPRRAEGVLLLSPAEGPSLSEAVRLFKVISSLRLSRPAKKGASALWKKGYAEKRASGAEELAAMRMDLKKPGIKAQAGGRTSPGKG